MYHKDLGDGYFAVPPAAVTINGIYLPQLNKESEAYTGQVVMLLPGGKAAMGEDGKRPYVYADLAACQQDKEVLLAVNLAADEVAAKTTPEEPKAAQIAKRLLELSGHNWSNIKLAGDVKAVANAYLQLRKVALPIVEAFEEVTDWRLGGETDRVYAWYEMEPLEIALHGKSRRPATVPPANYPKSKLGTMQEQYKELKECHELLLKTARRCARDLRHVIDEVPADNPLRERFKERLDFFRTVFDDLRDYRLKIHADMLRLECDLEKQTKRTEQLEARLRELAPTDQLLLQLPESAPDAPPF